MPKRRRTCRSASHSANHRATRTAIRTRWRAPDDLGTALTCFRRAIRAHRRLARLAPRFFDSVVVERERREHAAERRWMDSWIPAFIKVYGSAPDPLPAEPGPPPLPPPHIQIAVERELASWRLWFGLGRDLFRRFRVRHPHAWVDLSRIARLMEIGADLGRLATAGHEPQAQNEPDPYAQSWADLERIYGHPDTSTPSAQQTPPAPAIPSASTFSPEPKDCAH